VWCSRENTQEHTYHDCSTSLQRGIPRERCLRLPSKYPSLLLHHPIRGPSTGCPISVPQIYSHSLIGSMTLPVLARSETALSYAGLLLTGITLVWKTVGLSVIPGFDAIWGSSQYPQRGDRFPSSSATLSFSWDAYYLLLYGIIGCYAQWNALQLTTSQTTWKSTETGTPITGRKQTTATARQARKYGIFHVIMGVHHTVWSCTRSWGRLGLERFQLPLNYGYLPFTAGSLCCTYHGWKLTQTKAGTGNEDQTTPLDETIRHKTLLDTASILSCIPLFCFLPLNWFPNMERNRTFERNVWMATVWAPGCLFAYDAIYHYYYSSNSDPNHSRSNETNKESKLE
jgi:hypothetical protein